MSREELQKVLIASLATKESQDPEYSLKELEGLVEAVGGQVVGSALQRRDHPDSKTYFGKGKIEELREAAEHLQASLLIVDDELSGSHLANLQEALELPVLDRTALILDIFARRSRSALSRDQVELAQLQYRKTRLRGVGIYLSRQGGGIGTRGPGETKLETDRRALDLRISELKKSIEAAKSVLDNQRKKRMSQYTPRVALVGYTNSGKSSLTNYLMEYSRSQAHAVPEKDMLFTTLETYVRRIELEEGRVFYLSDTVGFIDHLPHSLVEAFNATLEEVLYADVLLILTDGSTPHSCEQLEVTKKVLRELGAEHIPTISVLTKSDLGRCIELPDSLSISVRTGEGMEDFLRVLKNIVFSDYRERTFFFPYGKEARMTALLSEGALLEQEYEEDGVRVKLFLHYGVVEKYKEYLLENRPLRG